MLLPVESGEGITLCITAKLEGIADAGFSGGCVHVDDIASTTSSASEVRVVGCIMLHCRDKAAEQRDGVRWRAARVRAPSERAVVAHELLSTVNPSCAALEGLRLPSHSWRVDRGGRAVVRRRGRG